MADNDVRKEMEQLRNDLAALRADVADLTKALKNAGANKAESVRNSIEEEIEMYREALRKKLDEARSRGYEAKEKVDDQIATHPYTSLLTAFGVGYVLAKLLHLGERR